MPLRAVTLDVGGTLLVESPSRAEIYAEAARRRGLAVKEAAMRRLMNRTHGALPLEVNGGFRYSDAWFRVFIERIFCGELGLAPSHLEAVGRELFERFSDPATFRTFPGALELLEGLRERGLRTAIVSNWGERLGGVLAGLGVTPRVDAVLISANERIEKPDRRIFLRACERLNVSPGDALHAGDNIEKDVGGARAAGLHAVLVDHGETHPSFEGCRVTRLTELLDMGRFDPDRPTAGPEAFDPR